MNYALFKSIHQFAGQNPVIDAIMIFFTKDALAVFALALLVMWLFGNETYKKTVIYAGITGVLGLLINFIISSFYFEPRPFVTHNVHVLISHAADASFPSDHTTGAFSLALAVLYRHHKIGVGMTVFAALTGLSRIYVGHHYPFDVFGSIVVSLIISAIVHKINPFLEPVSRVIIGIYNRIPLVPKKI